VLDDRNRSSGAYDEQLQVVHAEHAKQQWKNSAYKTCACSDALDRTGVNWELSTNELRCCNSSSFAIAVL
jgi:hypothetical protein